MGHDDVASGYPISTSFHRLTGCQRDPRNRGVTDIISMLFFFFNMNLYFFSKKLLY